MSSAARGDGDGVSVAVDRQPEEMAGEDAAVAQGTSSPGYHSCVPNLRGGGHGAGAGTSTPWIPPLAPTLTLQLPLPLHPPPPPGRSG